MARAAEGEANRNGDLRHLSIGQRDLALRDFTSQPFRDPAALDQRAVGQRHEKFLAADTTDEIDVAQALAQMAGDTRQHFVTRAVAIGVVH